MRPPFPCGKTAPPAFAGGAVLYYAFGFLRRGFADTLSEKSHVPRLSLGRCRKKIRKAFQRSLLLTDSMATDPPRTASMRVA